MPTSLKLRNLVSSTRSTTALQLVCPFNVLKGTFGPNISENWHSGNMLHFCGTQIENELFDIIIHQAYYLSSLGSVYIYIMLLSHILLNYNQHIRLSPVNRIDQKSTACLAATVWLISFWCICYHYYSCCSLSSVCLSVCLFISIFIFYSFYFLLFFFPVHVHA